VDKDLITVAHECP